MTEPQMSDEALARLTMDYEPVMLSGPTTKKTVKGPKGLPPPPGFPVEPPDFASEDGDGAP